MKLRSIPSMLVLSTLALLGTDSARMLAAAEEGVALAIVYDTSGSMGDQVRDATGKLTPKYRVANRALESIARQLQAYAARPVGGSTRRLDAGLWVFEGSGARRVVPFGKLNAQAMIDWARNFNSPGSGTPLGSALQSASQTILQSDLPQKHVLVITDGMNTVGPDPVAVLPGILKQVQQKQGKLGVYFVAFDVDAKLFDPVKKLGVKVFGAGDEKQLTAQLSVIMQKEILLEEPEPPKKN